MRLGAIILAHGSRNELEVREALDRLVEGVKAFIPREVEVRWAALRFNHPDLKEAVELLKARGVNKIVVVPYFLFWGRHVAEDIPRLVEELRGIHPDVEILVSNPIGLSRCLIEQVAGRIGEAVSELIPEGSDLPETPQAIEQKSFELVERLLPPLDLSEEERWVVKRIVHSAGDPQVSALVRFHPRAIPAALAAIREGRPIFTDVRMVLAGINHKLAGEFGCEVRCALDEPGVEERASREGITRGMAAFRSLGERLGRSIVVVGNSPTSLLALLELAGRGIRPDLIIGMPVGFVRAREAKEELMKRDIPYIAVEGTRGGSAMAAAAMNALLELALR